MTDSSQAAVPDVISLPASRSWLGPLMVLSGGVCIGFAPIGLRIGVEQFGNELGPQAIAMWRYIFATPILFALVLLIRRRLPRPPNLFIILAGTFFAIDIGLWHWALTMTSVSNATFIVNLGNVCAGLVAWFFLRERPANVWFVAAALAVAGAAALSLGGPGLHNGGLKGDLFALAAACFVAGYMLCSKLGRRNLSGIEAIFWLSVTESIVAFLMVQLAGERPVPLTPNGFIIPLLLAVVAHVMGQGLIVSGLGWTRTSVAGILVLSQPVVAAAVAWKLFEEPLTALQAAGAATILVAVWLAQRERAPRNQAA
ncbi:DMT family transporter [Hyphomonas sp. WL0036]|uniref:DMT family transporter n=1 Tax=Hyphomonas sediminis TaxID=2866160 RepID=UPI001C81460A|nr:DMT family transporter [Hyphomonas sediminis]MBY9065849.1 DMT family transporter [Hyphomonas sediminis]